MTVSRYLFQSNSTSGNVEVWIWNKSFYEQRIFYFVKDYVRLHMSHIWDWRTHTLFLFVGGKKDQGPFFHLIRFPPDPKSLVKRNQDQQRWNKRSHYTYSHPSPTISEFYWTSTRISEDVYGSCLLPNYGTGDHRISIYGKGIILITTD